jgi:hypothetical protein
MLEKPTLQGVGATSEHGHTIVNKRYGEFLNTTQERKKAMYISPMTMYNLKFNVV